MPAPRRTTLVAFLLGGAVLVAVPAAGAQSSLDDRRRSLDSRIDSLRDEIENGKRKEGVLSTEIEAASDGIRSLEGDIASLSAQLAELQADLERHRARLEELEARYREQTRHLNRLIADHRRAQRRLEQRLVDLYESGQSDAVEVLLQVESLSALIEQIDFMNEIGRQDRLLQGELNRLKISMREARERTAAIRAEVEEATAVLADKTEETAAARASLVVRQQELASARDQKQGLLAGVREERHEDEEDLEAMLASSAALTAQIQAAQSAPSSSGSSGDGSSGGGSSSGGGGGGSVDTTASSSGLIWPVSGVVTSGYGPRWGRMHLGIDISAPSGTTVRAAASGRVIVAGSMGGYGNIVVIDHGGGLATAYAHLSSIWAGGGSVSQGQGIGAVGCTGSCTGPHLHFEVRINGSPVNPLSYL